MKNIARKMEADVGEPAAGEEKSVEICKIGEVGDNHQKDLNGEGEQSHD